MKTQTVKTNQFYGLRLIKLIYKMLCILVVITCLGALGYISIQALNLPNGSAYARFTWWLPQALGLVLGGGLLALTLYVIAQVIEVQLAVNTKLNHILKETQSIPHALHTFEATAKQMSDEMEKIRLIVQNQARVSRLQNAPTNPAARESTSSVTPTQKTP